MPTLPRFFVPASAVSGIEVTLPPDDAHHARNVLRLHTGEAVTVCVGDGLVHRVVLTELAPGRVGGYVDETTPSRAEPRTRITIGQALPKNEDKVEQVLQHGTEAGAAAFYLFLSARSVARPDEARLKKRLERWRGIVKSAAQQSGRAVLPTVAWGGTPPVLGQGAGTFDAALLLHESATTTLAHALKPLPASASRLLVLVGPEGGFAEAEAAEAETRGATLTSLGPRILRTETAALVALSQILFAREAGD